MLLIEKVLAIKAAKVTSNEREDILLGVNTTLDNLGFDTDGEVPSIVTFDRLSPKECKAILDEFIPGKLVDFSPDDCKDAITILLYTDLAPIRTVRDIAKKKLVRREN